MTKNWKIFTDGNKEIFLNQKIAIHLSLGLYKRTSKLQEKPSAFKTSDFLPFYIFVGHLCPPGPGSSGPKSMRIHADPDPKHWF